MQFDSTRWLSRREFVTAAVAIGGASALGACQEVEQPGSETATATDDGATYPRGVDDPSSLPDRQHAWDEYLVHGAHGTTIQGQHQLMLGLSYEGSVPPTEDERAGVESALRTLERAFQWGSGVDKSGEVNNGLLFLLAYAPSYLDAVGIEVDGLQRPETILDPLGLPLTGEPRQSRRPRDRRAGRHSRHVARRHRTDLRRRGCQSARPAHERRHRDGHCRGGVTAL